MYTGFNHTCGLMSPCSCSSSLSWSCSSAASGSFGKSNFSAVGTKETCSFASVFSALSTNPFHTQSDIEE
ncbi:hypothetical protein LMOh7858_1792 [Listeria monocytogenes serotype 4b str. H7858]|nr:hypothetical protein LMOh7858_1792 [Listeria monocytogenes serotype 4b str. H7858]